MVQDTVQLVTAIRILSLLVRGFHTILKVETPVCKKKALSALIPAIAGLATIAVESLNSFLQRKRNKAMAKGMTAIKKDQSLAWNSQKQLENDFLMYGKYNVAQLQDIVSTVNGLRYRTLQIEKLLTGQSSFSFCVYAVYALEYCSKIAYMAQSLYFPL